MGPWFQALKMHSFCTVWLLDAGAGAQGDGAYIGTFQGYYAYAQSPPLPVDIRTQPHVKSSVPVTVSQGCRGDEHLARCLVLRQGSVSGHCHCCGE